MSFIFICIMKEQSVFVQGDYKPHSSIRLISLCVFLYLWSSNFLSQQLFVSCACPCIFIFHFVWLIICPVCLWLSSCEQLSLKKERDWVKHCSWKLDVQIRLWMCVFEHTSVVYINSMASASGKLVRLTTSWILLHKNMVYLVETQQ